MFAEPDFLWPVYTQVWYKMQGYCACGSYPISLRVEPLPTRGAWRDLIKHIQLTPQDEGVVAEDPQTLLHILKASYIL